ncbi:SDR family oxidoreductase [Candidatus Saccharibacteria bacterium]|nr:SDR family oxidoreductase [Candidatus Saccharibacteria bacterium]
MTTKNKVILITGSSRGLGKAIAILAYRQSYRVILHGSTDSDHLDALQKQLPGSMKVVFDVTDKQQTYEEIQKVLKQVGAIDVLVNNAGIILNKVKHIEDVDDEMAWQEWKVNVLGPIHCIQAVLPTMLTAGKGNVINMASIKAYPNFSTLSSFTYGHTKAAILQMTKALAKEYSPKGIRFNAIAPGYVITDMSKQWTNEAKKRINNGILLDRLANPDEIAPFVMFLASDDSAYITGSDFVIDGGYSIKGK